MAQRVLYATSTGEIMQWQDTAAFNYPAPPSGTSELVVTSDQWAARAAPFWVDNGVLTSGSVPAPAATLAQQAQAAMGVGIAITSTGTPALSATYPTSGPIWEDLKDEAMFIASFAEFSSGTSSLTFVLPSGPSITFTATSQLQAVVKAIGMYISALKTIIALNPGSGSLPAASATIA